MSGAGNIPIIKLSDLVVGKTYRLLNPTLNPSLAPGAVLQSEQIKVEYQKMLNNLHARPHKLSYKRSLPTGIIKLQFDILPSDEPVDRILKLNNSFVLTNRYTSIYDTVFQNLQNTEFAEESLRGGKRKTRKHKQKRKSRKSRRM
jgi:hypothetical protein